jgi:hypothetical protein
LVFAYHETLGKNEEETTNEAKCKQKLLYQEINSTAIVLFQTKSIE